MFSTARTPACHLLSIIFLSMLCHCHNKLIHTTFVQESFCYVSHSSTGRVDSSVSPAQRVSCRLVTHLDGYHVSLRLLRTLGPRRTLRPLPTIRSLRTLLRLVCTLRTLGPLRTFPVHLPGLHNHAVCSSPCCQSH